MTAQRSGFMSCILSGAARTATNNARLAHTGQELQHHGDIGLRFGRLLRDLLRKRTRQPRLHARGRQRVDVTFTVVYAVKNVASVKGRGNAQALAPLKSATRTALIGWRPNGAEALVGFVSGQQLAFRQGWQWWADNFKTQILIP